jgi:putative ABC transport system substrate-binding protein
VEGRNLVFDPRSAEGKAERYADLVRDFVRLNTDVIVTVGNLMALRAKEVTTTVPIVMASSANPDAAGLVESLARPGGNITGLAFDAGPELQSKRLELLKEALPRIARVDFLGWRSEWDSPSGENVQKAARALRLRLFHAPVNSTPPASSSLEARPRRLSPTMRHA